MKRLLLAIAFALILLSVLLSCTMQPVKQRPGPEMPQLEVLPVWVTPQSVSVAFRSTIGGWISDTPVPIPTNHPAYEADTLWPLGIECTNVLTTMWNTAPSGCSGSSCSTSNINWSNMDNCIAYAATQKVKLQSGDVISRPVTLRIPPMWDSGKSTGSGTSGDPYNYEYVPSWFESDFLQSFTYSDGKYYWGYKYDSTTAQDRLVQFIEEAGARYTANDQVVLVRIVTGFSGESQPTSCNSSHSGCDDNTLKDRHELAVASGGTGTTCAEYRTFVARLAEAGIAAFPNKSVVIDVAAAPCGSSDYDKSYEGRWGMYMVDDGYNGAWWLTPTPQLGMSLNTIDPDAPDADTWGSGNTGSTPGPGWGQYAVAAEVTERNLVHVSEYGSLPNGTTRSWEYNYWTALAAGGLHSDFFSTFYSATPEASWYTYDSWRFWDVIWERLGVQADIAWVTFRDAEWPHHIWYGGTSQYGESGRRSDWTNNMVLLTPTAYPQYCDSSVINAAATRIANPSYSTHTFYYYPCGLPRTPGPTPFYLPTPNATIQATPSPDATSQYNLMQRLYDRQARRVTAGASMAIAADTEWSHYGNTGSVDLTLAYLDLGTDDVTVSVSTGATTYTDHTIDKLNSGIWKEETWSVPSAYISNTIAISEFGDAFVRISAGASTAFYVHDLQVDVESETPTPSPTPTATMTASVTPTPSTTPTPTATPTATATPQSSAVLNEICASALVDNNNDGQIDPQDRFVEIYNGSASVNVDLTGWTLEIYDEYDYLGAYEILDQRLVASNRLVIYQSDTVIEIPEAGSMGLIAPWGATIDSVIWTAQTTGLCYARATDGGSWTANQTQSVGSAN